MITQKIKSVLHNRGWSYCRLPRSIAENPGHLFHPSLKEVIRSRFEEEAKFWSFIQVGANDGQANDELGDLIRNYRWKGLLIEPQPAAFELLKTYYRDQEQLQFANCAISDFEGTQTLYTVNGEAGSQIASFDPEHVKKHLVNANRKIDLAEIEVTAMPLKTLMSQKALSQPNIIQIDTEGYDFEVVKQIPLKDHRPEIIRYEHLHLSTNDYNDAVTYLAGCGYQFVIESSDTIAVLST